MKGGYDLMRGFESRALKRCFDICPIEVLGAPDSADNTFWDVAFKTVQDHVGR